ncbi:hypothetical protein AMTRI_Chr01g132340 [Amborella trichopoda]|uniref:Glutaredoxin domain-containing protein n=1 Tax=Amborella trichopoda TaxID=13333 RepID=W1NPD5_AMBTC|nr:glutaredoxin-C1 [Amborella trichopoda]ERM97642.1 hypothetical protein AMTR_s00130p00050470 [Amborella trichopoda]|eukprot:XP_011629365.1 glutaredoxin-C1 [Amborella trichopoda]
MDNVKRMASQNAVVVFSKSTCPMSHAIQTFFHDLGVHPTVHEIDELPNGREIERALANLVGRGPPIPATFIGGQFVGPTDKVMSLHLSGKLVPMLRKAGALWL